MRLVGLVALALTLVTAHSPPLLAQPDASPATSRAATFDANFGTVWGACIEVLTAQSWPLDVVDRDSGVITSEWVVVSETERGFAACGSASSDSLFAQHMRLSASVQQLMPGTRLRVSIAFASNVDSECTSTQVLEAGLIEQVAALMSDDAQAEQAYVDSLVAAELEEIPIGDVAFCAGATRPLGEFGTFAKEGPAFAVRASLNNTTLPYLQLWGSLAASIFGSETQPAIVRLGPGLEQFATQERERFVVSLHLGPQLGSGSRMAFFRPRAGIGPGYYVFFETVRTTLVGESEAFDFPTTAYGRFGWRAYVGVDLFFTPRMGIAVDYIQDRAVSFHSAHFESFTVGFVIGTRALRQL